MKATKIKSFEKGKMERLNKRAILLTHPAK